MQQTVVSSAHEAGTHMLVCQHETCRQTLMHASGREVQQYEGLLTTYISILVVSYPYGCVVAVLATVCPSYYNLLYQAYRSSATSD